MMNQSHLRTKVIACATVIEEMHPFLPPDMPYDVLDFGLHLHPPELKKILQAKIDQTSPDADVILLGYGLCSMAVVGLVSPSATLVIPRTDDCVALFLGSCAAYKDQARQEPGTYYLTKGWIKAGASPFDDYPRLAARYGMRQAKWMIALMLKNYTRLGLINTGQYEIERYRQYARDVATQFGLRFEEIAGSPALLKKMITGPWDADFVVVPAGQTIRYEHFFPIPIPES